MHILRGTSNILLIAIHLVCAVACYAGGSGTRGRSMHTTTTSGYGGNRSPYGGSHSSTSAKTPSNNKTYHPGVTRPLAQSKTNSSDPHSYTSIHRKIEERKKKEEAKKKPEPVEVKSTNRLISPPKPKAPKPVKPIGPFVTK